MAIIILGIASLVVSVFMVLQAIFMSDAKMKFYSRNRKNELYNEKTYFIIKRVITLCYAGFTLALGVGMLIDQDASPLILIGILLIEALVDRGFYNDKI